MPKALKGALPSFTHIPTPPRIFHKEIPDRAHYIRLSGMTVDSSLFSFVDIKVNDPQPETRNTYISHWDKKH